MRNQHLTTLLTGQAMMRGRYAKMRSKTHNLVWQRFDSARTQETFGDSKLVLNNHVSLSIPAPCTHRDTVAAIARQSQEPMEIQSLADVLSKIELVRGKVIFGFVGDKIDQIAAQYEDMYWWISKKGLNMATVPPAAGRLSRFDDFAGKLCVDRWKDGKLPKKSLMVIAKELDVAGFTLRELQPAQWKPISLHNQANPRQPIKTFEQACRYPKYVRSVRKRLYVARARYMQANSLVSPPPRVS